MRTRFWVDRYLWLFGSSHKEVLRRSVHAFSRFSQTIAPHSIPTTCQNLIHMFGGTFRTLTLALSTRTRARHACVRTRSGTSSASTCGMHAENACTVWFFRFSNSDLTSFELWFGFSGCSNLDLEIRGPGVSSNPGEGFRGLGFKI